VVSGTPQDDGAGVDTTAPERRAETPLTLGGRKALANLRSNVFGVESGTEQFGRYTLGQRLGSGAFGDVYDAFDAKLERHVALKVLKPATSTSQRARLVREAQAMAAVEHPALVKIFEVGHKHDRDFIAMELVRGTTLLGWIAVNPPGTRSRFDKALRLLRAAGAGLAAAHRSDLVHRDFKPANVLVGTDDTAKVGDFGLARTSRQETPESPRQPGASDDALGPTLTRSGAVLGTPLYMSPEQHDGERADARSDQFSFAVTAWEVVYGETPFSGRTAQLLRMSIGADKPVAPDVVGVPDTVGPVLVRALSLDPADRFPSMDALLDALEIRPRRARWLVVGSGVAVVCAAGLVAADLGSGPECGAVELGADYDRVWNPERQAVVSAGVTATGLPEPEALVARVDAALREYRRRWTRQRVAACEATWHRETASEATLDRATRCLRDALATTNALVARMESPTRESASRLLTALDRLPDPRECARPESTPEIESEAAQALRAELAAGNASSLAGDYAAASEEADAVLVQARAQSLADIQGRAAFLAGTASNELSRGRGDELLRESYLVAIDLDQPVLAARRAGSLASSSAFQGGLEEADRWLRRSEVALARAPDAGPVEAAVLERTRCRVLAQQGKADPALAACREAVAKLEVADDPGRLWSAQLTLCNRLVSAGRTEEGAALLLQLLAQAEARVGPTHPRVGGTLMNLGNCAKRAGDLAAGIEYYRRAKSVFSASYGPEHSWVASALLNVASLEVTRPDFAAAEAALTEALAISEPHHDARTARILHNLGDLRRRQGRFDEALTLLTRVSDLEVELLPRDHPQTATTHHSRAMLHLELRQFDQARTQALRAVEIRRDHPRAPQTAKHLAILARIEQRAGRPAEGVAFARRAESIFKDITTRPGARISNLARLAELLLVSDQVPEAVTVVEKALGLHTQESSMSAPDLADLRFAAARVYAASGDVGRGRRLAHEALIGLENVGPEHDATARIEAVTAWLANP